MDYKPSGVCSRLIHVELDGDKIANVEFVGGCARKYSRNQQPCKRNGRSRSDQTSGRNKMRCKTNILP